MAHNSETRFFIKERKTKGIVEVVKSIHIDGSHFMRERNLLVINNKNVGLTRKSFKYFTILAFNLARGENNGGVNKYYLEDGFYQTRYINRMKGEIKDGLEGVYPSVENPIIENDHNGHYRLVVDPGIITFNEALLKKYDDYDISSLFSS